jgi:hypothetical protein
LERLNARGLACHLIRAIGHHIVRLACRSVSIMARLTAWGDRSWTTQTGITHTGITPFSFRRVETGPSRSPDAGVVRSFNRQPRKPAAAKFVPEPLAARRAEAMRGTWLGTLPGSWGDQRLYPASLTRIFCLHPGVGTGHRVICAQGTSDQSWWQMVMTIVRPLQNRKNARIARACGHVHLAPRGGMAASRSRDKPIQGYCRIPPGTRRQLNHP